MIQLQTRPDKQKKDAKGEKLVIGSIYVILAFALIVLLFTAKSLFFTANTIVQGTTNQGMMQVSAAGKMSLTSYDKELARKMMDKDNDVQCDDCGMPVEMCMDSGQMQCNMGSESTIGVLESQHIHADWKIYLNGQSLSFEGKDHMGRMRANLPVSSFVHVDSGAPAPEKTGDVLHMHATGVPLWIFFESLGMKFNNECLILDTGETYCNDPVRTLKFYVNGHPNKDYESYVFNDLDKILISYGDEPEQQVQTQRGSITNFARAH